MDVSMSSALFLPMNWQGDRQGVESLSWRDDPLQGEIILQESDYRRCFPDNHLPWPKLGAILLPENAPPSIQWEVACKPVGNTIMLTARVRNTGQEVATLEYVRLALPMDQCFRGNDVFKYEQNVLRHSGLIGHCAYLYWQKPGGRPPLYLMVAQGDTAVSRFFVDERYEQGSMTASFEGLYALEMSDSPVTFAAGEEVAYSFRLAIIQEESQLPSALMELGGLGTDVLPGMAVPRGEPLWIKLSTHRKIDCVYFSDSCAPVQQTDTGLYRSIGAGSGEKKLIVSYTDGGFSRLKFFIMDPVEDMLQEHAAHIAARQFETDPEDPCYHGILAWNMTDRRRVNRKHNPFANWMAGGSDEIGLVSGLFLSEKNVYWPVEDEIRTLGLHVKDFIEKRLTEQPGNRVHRMVPWFEMFEPWAGRGADDVWRAYNYVHVANICFNMYRIAKAGSYTFLEPPIHYLRKAYDYAIAMFQYWMFPDGEGATKYGNMGEMNFPLKLLPTLHAEGLEEEAGCLEALLRQKARYFSTKEYPFGSEMAFDTTAYEAVYAYAKMIGDERMITRSIAATLANRARTPVWHKYGVDVRAGGDSCWNVSYMTQLGIWPVVDQLLEGKLRAPDSALLAYASTLAGFCMYNSGGYWDDAPINRHASWWVMNERLMQGNRSAEASFHYRMSGEVGLGYFGALYAICAFVLVHPRMGNVCLGCSCQKAENGIEIIPAPCFGLRLCDMIRNYALQCEGCEIRSVMICGSSVAVKVAALPGRKDELILRIRRGTPEQWLTLRGEHQLACTFCFQLDTGTYNIK